MPALGPGIEGHPVAQGAAARVEEDVDPLKGIVPVVLAVPLVQGSSRQSAQGAIRGGEVSRDGVVLMAVKEQIRGRRQTVVGTLLLEQRVQWVMNERNATAVQLQTALRAAKQVQLRIEQQEPARVIVSPGEPGRVETHQMDRKLQAGQGQGVAIPEAPMGTIPWIQRIITADRTNPIPECCPSLQDGVPVFLRDPARRAEPAQPIRDSEGVLERHFANCTPGLRLDASTHVVVARHCQESLSRQAQLPEETLDATPRCGVLFGQPPIRHIPGETEGIERPLAQHIVDDGFKGLSQHAVALRLPKSDPGAPLLGHPGERDPFMQIRKVKYAQLMPGPAMARQSLTLPPKASAAAGPCHPMLHRCALSPRAPACGKR